MFVGGSGQLGSVNVWQFLTALPSHGGTSVVGKKVLLAEVDYTRDGQAENLFAHPQY